MSLGYRYQGDLLSRAPTMNAWGKPTARAEHAGAGVRRIYEGVPLCRTGRGSRIALRPVHLAVGVAHRAENSRSHDRASADLEALVRATVVPHGGMHAAYWDDQPEPSYERMLANHGAAVRSSGSVRMT